MSIHRRLREWFRGGAAQAPGHAPELSQPEAPCPLTPAERERITALELWDLWYFNYAPGSRESHRIALCFHREQADAIVRERGGVMAASEPGAKGYHIHGPISLIEFYPEAPDGPDHPVRVALDRLARGDDSPILLKYYTLTPAERALLKDVLVWDLWYEDHFGEDRDAFQIAYCFSEEQAQALVRQRGSRMLESGYDGCVIHGPYRLLELFQVISDRPDHPLLIALDMLKRGVRHPIFMKS